MWHFLYPFILDRRLGCFHILVIVINIGVLISFWGFFYVSNSATHGLQHSRLPCSLFVCLFLNFILFLNFTILYWFCQIYKSFNACLVNIQRWLALVSSRGRIWVCGRKRQYVAGMRESAWAFRSHYAHWSSRFSSLTVSKRSAELAFSMEQLIKSKPKLSKQTYKQNPQMNKIRILTGRVWKGRRKPDNERWKRWSKLFSPAQPHLYPFFPYTRAQFQTVPNG